MSLSVGHVLIIDNEFQILERLWCLYDIYLAIKKKENNYKIDFYKANVGDQQIIVGITDGLISIDLKHGKDKSFNNKKKREKQFPIDFFQKVLQINSAEANVKDDMDKKFLRNIICNQLRNAEPLPKTDEKYKEFNDAVAGFFITTSLDRLFIDFDSTQLLKCFGVLEKCLSVDIRLDLVDCDKFNHDEDLTTTLFKSLPKSLQTLHVKMKFTDDINNRYNLETYIPTFKKMRELTIFGVKLSSDLIKALCCCLVTNSEIKLEKLTLINCGMDNTGLKDLFSALNGNKYLKELNLSSNKFNITDDVQYIIEILKKSEITNMNFTNNESEITYNEASNKEAPKNFICPHILLNLNKRFRTMKLFADNYQTPKVRNTYQCIIYFFFFFFFFFLTILLLL